MDFYFPPLFCTTPANVCCLRNAWHLPEGVRETRRLMPLLFSLSPLFCTTPANACCLRNAWHLPGGVGALSNTTARRVLATRADGSQTVEEAKGAAGMGSADKRAILNSLRSQVSHASHASCHSVYLFLSCVSHLSSTFECRFRCTAVLCACA